MRRADLYTHHHIQRELLSVRERMSRVLSTLQAGGYEEFQSMFTVEEGRMGVVVTLLAMLELIKEELIELVQNEPYGPIYVKSLATED
jgi:segregation and condensation protein A